MTPQGMLTRLSNGDYLSIDQFGQAPRRGRKHNGLAKQFLADNPIGTMYHPSKFGEWGIWRGYLEEPSNITKTSPEWQAYVLRRSELRDKINNAANHRRMGSDAFFIDIVERGKIWEVITPVAAVLGNKSIQKILRTSENEHQKTLQKCQSVNWKSQSPLERAFAELNLGSLVMLKARAELEAFHSAEQASIIKRHLESISSESIRDDLDSVEDVEALEALRPFNKQARESNERAREAEEELREAEERAHEAKLALEEATEKARAAREKVDRRMFGSNESTE